MMHTTATTGHAFIMCVPQQMHIKTGTAQRRTRSSNTYSDDDGSGVILAMNALMLVSNRSGRRRDSRVQSLGSSPHAIPLKFFAVYK